MLLHYFVPLVMQSLGAAKCYSLPLVLQNTRCLWYSKHYLIFALLIITCCDGTAKHYLLPLVLQIHYLLLSVLQKFTRCLWCGKALLVPNGAAKHYLLPLVLQKILAVFVATMHYLMPLVLLSITCCLWYSKHYLLHLVLPMALLSITCCL